jgi:hypothetical protein
MKFLTLLAVFIVFNVSSLPVLANERTVTKTEDGRSISRTVDTKKGEVTIQNDVKKTGEGTWDSTRTITGTDGKTKTINTKGTKTETGVHKEQTWTGKDGTEKSRTVDVNKNEDGTYTRTVKGASGKERSATAATRKEAMKKTRPAPRKAAKE